MRPRCRSTTGCWNSWVRSIPTTRTGANTSLAATPIRSPGAPALRLPTRVLPPHLPQRPRAHRPRLAARHGPAPPRDRRHEQRLRTVDQSAAGDRSARVRATANRAAGAGRPGTAGPAHGVVLVAAGAAAVAWTLPGTMGQPAAAAPAGALAWSRALAVDDARAAQQRARALPDLAEAAARAAGNDPATLAALSEPAAGTAAGGAPELSFLLPAAAAATGTAARALGTRDAAATRTDAADAAPAATAARPLKLDRLHRRDQRGNGGLAVAVQHAGIVEIEQRILDAGETCTLAALDHDDVLGLVGVEDRHAVDRARLVVARHRIDDVVGADDQCHVGGLELGVDLVQIGYQVVRYPGLRQQHVHVAGHAAGHRMDREAHRYTAIDQQLHQLPHLVLRLRHGHAIAGNDDDFLRERHHDAGVRGLDRLETAGDFGARGGGAGIAEAREQYVAE